MGRNVTLLVGVACFAIAGVLVWKFLPGTAPQGAPAAPERPAASGASAAEVDAAIRSVRSGGDLLAPAIYRREHAKLDDAAARERLRTAVERRGEEVRREIARQAEDLLAAWRYADAAALLERYRVAWKGLPASTAFASMLAELRRDQERLVARHDEDVQRLLDDQRFLAAEDSLEKTVQLEDEYARRLKAVEESLRRRLRVARHEASTANRPVGPTQREGGKPKARPVPPPPPPLPGVPHPDVKRLADARTLLAKAKRLFTQGRHGPATKALDDFTGFYGDLAFVRRESETVGAMRAVAAYRAQGVKGLFHAAATSVRGRRIRLVYRFESDEERADWEQLPTIPHKDGGEFQTTRNGVRGSGVMSFLHRGVFDDDVAIRCIAVPNRLKSHGLLFAQDGNETRHLMWLVANHWFVEGENYVKERPGHSILMFGKGVNADVPVDSPEVGFIFRGGTIRTPQLVAGAEARLAFTYKGTTMTGSATYRGETGERSGSTIGDDGRGIERVRPGLFVLENTVAFRDIVIEGRLHPSFEKKRVQELLDRMN